MKIANVVSLIAAACLLLATAACRDENGGTLSEKKSVMDFFEMTVGNASFRAQVAVTSAEMQQGLMWRKSLGKNDGMLFVYERPQQMSFWMRNTGVALDIGFFTADGTLREIYPLTPFDETGVRSVRRDLLFALEMNQGWFAANNVRVGDKLPPEVISAALKARGFDKLPPAR